MTRLLKRIGWVGGALILVNEIRGLLVVGGLLLAGVAMNAITPSGIVYHRDLDQGTHEWIEARRGLLTASEMSRIITPTTLKSAANDKSRAHVFEIAAQRITGYVEPAYISDDMLRGQEDEIDARALYQEHYAEVENVGFITNDRFGFTLGYSPDGLVGTDGTIEIKSRRQHFQVETIMRTAIPPEHVIQVQTGLLVSGREWCDFISFSAGMPMAVIRAHAVPEIQDAIIEAATAFEAKVAEVEKAYRDAVRKGGFLPTERRVEREIMI